MKVNPGASRSQTSTQMDIAKVKLAGGEPLITMVDEIVGPDMVKAQLIVDAFGTKAGIRITLKQSIASPSYRSLADTIKGSEYAAPIRKGDVLCFNQVHPETFEGNVVAMVGQVTARTHDKMRGDIQLVTAMARVSKSSVRASGATQTVTIAEATKAMSVGSFDDIEKAWKIVKDLNSPGGDAGFLIRDASGMSGGDWFEKKNEGLPVFLSLLDQQDAFAGGNLIELIPAWSLKVSRDQMALDVDLRSETASPVLGPVSRLFDYGDRRGQQGFVPCVVILADEPELGYNNSLTGNIIRVAVGVQPCYRREALSFLKLPTNIRPYGGTPNRVATYWSDEQIANLKAERIQRRGPDAPIAKSNSSRGDVTPAQVQEDYRPQKPAIRMGMPKR